MRSLLQTMINALLAGADQAAYQDDDTILATHGYAKQGSGSSNPGVTCLNVPVTASAKALDLQSEH